MRLPFLLLSCIDSEISPSDIFQQSLLTKVFQNTDTSFQAKINLELPFQNVDIRRKHPVYPRLVMGCRLSYRKWKLRFFSLTGWRDTIGQLQIEFLPPSLDSLTVSACDQKFHLNTRRFPSHARFIVLRENRILGTIDFQGLPYALVVFDIAHNNLSGTVFFDDLPKSLENLDLSGNARLGQKVVYYTEIPESIGQILLSRTKMRSVRPRIEGNVVKKVRSDLIVDLPGWEKR